MKREEGGRVVGFRRVLFTTMMNPKALVIALVLLPPPETAAPSPFARSFR